MDAIKLFAEIKHKNENNAQPDAIFAVDLSNLC
jgi:hypothetical protein